MSDKWFYGEMGYFHFNPVRKGHVMSPEDWKYISAGNWILDKHDVITLDPDQEIIGKESLDQKKLTKHFTIFALTRKMVKPGYC